MTDVADDLLKRMQIRQTYHPIRESFLSPTGIEECLGTKPIRYVWLNHVIPSSFDVAPKDRTVDSGRFINQNNAMAPVENPVSQI